jgi:PAS domain S-box-containing protein
MTMTGKAPAERLPIKAYTSADGLGSNYVSYVMRDSRGFLWFCTRDGLSRFDGSRFVTYQVGDKNAPPGIEYILETRGGIYWITTTGGLYRFDPNSPINKPTTGTSRPSLNAKWMGDWRAFLYEDHSGNVWSGGAALYRMREEDEKVSFDRVDLNLPADLSGEFSVRSAYEGQDGSLWLVTTWGLVRRLPDGREVFYSVESSRRDALASALGDRDGRIWVGRASGVYVIKPESLDELAQLGGLTVRKLDDLARTRPHGEKQVRLPEKPGEIIKFADLERHTDGKFLYQTSDGHVWISAGDGVVEYDGRSFHPHTAAQGLLKGIGRMVEDTSGNLWLEWSTGVFRLDRRGLTTFDLADGLKTPTIFALIESRDGKLYAASENFFLSQFDGKGFQTIRPPLPLNARGSWTSNLVLQDHTGEWWILTNEKLYRFAASRDFSDLARQRPLAAYTSRDGLKSDEMFHIFEDSKGDLWVSVRGSSSEQCGLSRWNRATERFYTFAAAEGFPSGKSPCSFTEDRNGNLWLGFYEGGLARYASGRFNEFTTADGLPNGLITALHLDRQGRLWAASALGGLSRVDDPAAAHPRFVNYSTDNGLASNNVRSITEDLYGNIYAGTARGVEKLSPDATRINHYSVKDGLAGDFVNVAFRDRGGALWFGTPNGLSRLIPEAEGNTSAPTVWLGGLRIAGENRSVPELGAAEIVDLELAPAQNNLQIDFFGIDFNAGETLRYQYMLEGADKGWNAPTEQRTVNYSNLAPGSYRYLIRAVNGEGVASVRPASVSFRVLAPIWRRWWFLMIATFVIASAIFAFARSRYQRLKALRESENRFRTLAQTASDAIITIDEESRIVYINQAAEKVFGYTQQEMTGAELPMLMPESFRHLHRAGFARYRQTGERHIVWEAIELPGLHKNGSQIPLEISFGEFTKDGRRYFTGIARDITERKRAEEAIRKSREERLAELERVRTRIATDLHDDIGSSLTQISILSEVAQRRMGADSQLSAPLSMIAGASRELVDSMSDIVWAINPKKDHLNDLTQRMRRFASDVLTARNIAFEFSEPAEENDVQLGANIRREIFLIFKESVNNLVRHSACTEAEIDFRIAEGSLELKVRDNGKGFDTSQDSEGHGLSSMRRRAEGIGGRLEMISIKGKGTTITLEMPLAGSAGASPA